MGFKVIINQSKVKFSACHFLKKHFKCSRLHGHNFYVSVEISGSLDKNYFVIDFMELNKKLKLIVEPMDHYVLIPTESKDIKIKENKDLVEVNTPIKKYLFPRSDVCYLPIQATTSELLAKYIHDKLKEFYKDKRITVRVGESKSSIASYEE